MVRGTAWQLEAIKVDGDDDPRRLRARSPVPIGAFRCRALGILVVCAFKFYQHLCPVGLCHHDRGLECV